jgi:hypothetical protein
MTDELKRKALSDQQPELVGICSCQDAARLD